MILIAFFVFVCFSLALSLSVCLCAWLKKQKFDIQNWQINVNGGVFVYALCVWFIMVQCRVTWEMVLDSYVQLGIEREREGCDSTVLLKSRFEVVFIKF